jgi:phosphoglycolate phosphatase
VNLLLFDIDGTLLDTGGAGLRALRDAWIEEFDLRDRTHDFPRLDLAGSTDSGIVRFLFDHFGMEHDPDRTGRFFHRYAGHLRRELAADHGPRRGRLLPGVTQLMASLRAAEGSHALGLLTGNTAEGARTKVEHFGLGGIFGFGAYGDDHHDRNELGPVALQRARHHTGRDFAPDRVFVIGDTPKDIRCARACGAWAIAVATGSYSRAELETHEPDEIFDDFTDAEAFCDVIDRLPEPRASD